MLIVWLAGTLLTMLVQFGARSRGLPAVKPNGGIQFPEQLRKHLPADADQRFQKDAPAKEFPEKWLDLSGEQSGSSTRQAD